MFLTRLKTTGMSLEEIKRYLQLAEAGPASIPQRMAILKRQKARIQNDISRLLATHKIIDYKMNHYNEALLKPDLSHVRCDLDE